MLLVARTSRLLVHILLQHSSGKEHTTTVLDGAANVGIRGCLVQISLSLLDIDLVL